MCGEMIGGMAVMVMVVVHFLNGVHYRRLFLLNVGIENYLIWPLTEMSDDNDMIPPSTPATNKGIYRPHVGFCR